MRSSIFRNVSLSLIASGFAAFSANSAVAQPAPAAPPPAPAPQKPAENPAPAARPAEKPAAKPGEKGPDAERTKAPTGKTEATGEPPRPGENPLPPSGPPAAVPEGSTPAVAPDAAAASTGSSAASPEGAAGAPADPNAPPPPDLQSVADDVQGLRTDLENFKFQWQRERDIHTAITTRALTIGGTVQTRFGFSDQAVSGPATGLAVYKRKTSFDVPTALLNFNGNLFKDYEDGRNLSYQLSFGVSQQTNSNNSFLNLLNANITYSFLPTTSPEYPALTLSVGQQLLPFGLEVPASEELKPVIRNAQFTTPPNANRRAVVTGLNLGRRDVGAILRGDIGVNVDYGYNYRQALLAYAVGILNGSGPNTLDENDNKDIIGRVAFTVPSDYNSWLRQITLGGSVYIGKQNLYTVETAPTARTTLQGKGRRNRYGGDIYYNHWPFGVTYEYIRGEDAVTPGTGEVPGRKTVKSDSHVATFFLSFGEQFVAGFRNQGRYDDWWPKTYQPFFRYDRLNPDIDYKKDPTKPADPESLVTEVFTAGLNIFFAETTKFQLNYNHTLNRANSDAPQPNARLVVAKRHANEVLAQVQFGF
ncbi:MAG TPA: hypothetical protein VG937_08700 [Polyangiaceae bacterium]|nr:hypothetical protein [Polyangiaceae bacterium]